MRSFFFSSSSSSFSFWGREVGGGWREGPPLLRVLCVCNTLKHNVVAIISILLFPPHVAPQNKKKWSILFLSLFSQHGSPRWSGPNGYKFCASLLLLFCLAPRKEIFKTNFIFDWINQDRKSLVRLHRPLLERSLCQSHDARRIAGCVICVCAGIIFLIFSPLTTKSLYFIQITRQWSSPADFEIYLYMSLYCERATAYSHQPGCCCRRLLLNGHP